MRSLSATQRNTILTMLDSGHSPASIASSTGLHRSTISRLRSKERSILGPWYGLHSPLTLTP
ncbi:hypothetical protein EDC04DRAFT_2770609 [Pisolithus marmoratus]|nr:hypothetical protein EDC04DRAFT_2770609 [Pisolithus marmoratus]